MYGQREGEIRQTQATDFPYQENITNLKNMMTFLQTYFENNLTYLKKKSARINTFRLKTVDFTWL